jgi:hypothetical protein
MITRRCSERRFFLRPDEETNNAFIYCLALAARRAKVEVTFSVSLSNHHHTGIHDRDGNFPIVIEHLRSGIHPRVLFRATSPRTLPRSTCQLLSIRDKETKGREPRP